MKLLKYLGSIAFGFAVVFLSQSCRDTKSAPLPVFETAVNGFALFKGDKFLSASDLAKTNPYSFRWVSVDNINTVNKVEFFVTLFEDYTDKDGNDRTAVHGKKLFKTLEGGTAPANRVFTDQTVTSGDIYNLFKDAAFDYGLGGGKKAVFDQMGRTTAKRFTDNDYFSLSWNLTTADGRKFTEWSPAVCNESPAYLNCSLNYFFK